jgi:hypothetical protein
MSSSLIVTGVLVHETVGQGTLSLMFNRNKFPSRSVKVFNEDMHEYRNNNKVYKAYLLQLYDLLGQLMARLR